jgi:hypothetical protein
MIGKKDSMKLHQNEKIRSPIGPTAIPIKATPNNPAMNNNITLTQLILNTGETTFAPPSVFCPNLCRLLEPMLVKQGATIPGNKGWYTQIQQGEGYAFFVVCDEKDMQASLTAVAWTPPGAQAVWNLLTQAAKLRGISSNREVRDMPASIPWLATYFSSTIVTCPVNSRWIEGFTRCLAAAMISREMSHEKILTTQLQRTPSA